MPNAHAHHDDPAFWDAEPSGMAGMRGNRQGTDALGLSHSELLAMGLTEEDIRLQLNSGSPAQPPTGTQTGMAAKSRPPPLDTSSTSKDQMAAELRSLGLNEEDVRMQLAAAPNSPGASMRSNNPGGGYAYEPGTP